MSGHPIERYCHKCGAEPGQPCVGKRGPRKAFHKGRGGRSAIQAVTAHRLKVESPIEDMLTSSILGWIDHYGVGRVTVSTQVPVGPYRADIMIESDGRKLVVECDGAAFHSNPNAIAHDKRRDRYFLLNGISVMRFTGAEIQRDPRGCAAEVGMWILRR
jgi:very-short-patch-repair endonuclease